MKDHLKEEVAQFLDDVPWFTGIKGFEASRVS